MATSWILSRKEYDLVSLADPVVDLFLRGAGMRLPRRRNEFAAAHHAGPLRGPGAHESRPLRLAAAAGRKR